MNLANIYHGFLVQTATSYRLRVNQNLEYICLMNQHFFLRLLQRLISSLLEHPHRNQVLQEPKGRVWIWNCVLTKVGTKSKKTLPDPLHTRLLPGALLVAQHLWLWSLRMESILILKNDFEEFPIPRLNLLRQMYWAGLADWRFLLDFDEIYW